MKLITLNAIATKAVNGIALLKRTVPNYLPPLKSMLLLVCCLSFGISAWAQTYHNEWVNPEQVYYPIQVTESQLIRIPYSSLAATSSLPPTRNNKQHQH